MTNKPLIVTVYGTRPEAIAVTAGTPKLIGTRRDDIVREDSLLLSDESIYSKMAHASNPYGDGRATDRTVAALHWFLLNGTVPDDFDYKPTGTMRK